MKKLLVISGVTLAIVIASPFWIIYTAIAKILGYSTDLENKYDL